MRGFASAAGLDSYEVRTIASYAHVSLLVASVSNVAAQSAEIVFTDDQLLDEFIDRLVEARRRAFGSLGGWGELAKRKEVA